jgi:hypothetical protein
MQSGCAAHRAAALHLSIEIFRAFGAFALVALAPLADIPVAFGAQTHRAGIINLVANAVGGFWHAPFLPYAYLFPTIGNLLAVVDHF